MPGRSIRRVFGIQTSELLVIALIAILLFGPERVPEFFHKAGRLLSKLQRSADDLWTSVQTEMNEVTKPLEEVGKEITAIGQQMGESLGLSSTPDQESDAEEEAEPAPGDEPDESET